MSSLDAIGAAQAHLIIYMKLVADTLWEVQQLASFDAASVSSWASRLVQAADEMDRLLVAIPDYAAVVGPRETLEARLRACEAEQEALLAALQTSIDAGGAFPHAQLGRVIFFLADCADIHPYKITPYFLPPSLSRSEQRLAMADAQVRDALAAVQGARHETRAFQNSPTY